MTRQQKQNCIKLETSKILVTKPIPTYSLTGIPTHVLTILQAKQQTLHVYQFQKL
jgi:hypothetical protein